MNFAYDIIKTSKKIYDKNYEAALIKFYSMMRTRPLIDSTNLEGSSPPGVFVGRFGYPKVFVGPLIPPFHGDTSLLDTPENWFGRSIKEIVDFRFSLVRGKFLTGIKDFDNRIVGITREIALADESPDVEVEFEKKPYSKMVFDDNVQPFGPSAPLGSIFTDNIKYEKRIEKAYGDTDLKANNAVLSLYDKGVLVSKIQKAFSVGAFGIEKNRRFVPTRWSITAVDDIISKDLVENTRDNPMINEYRIYEINSLDNRWIILMMPREWCYELIEAWYPDTLWNPDGREIVIFSDFEFYKGRKTYADIGGCYYAARLAVNELLNKEKRQAGVVILRETHSGYLMPVGVWNVRESVRASLKTKPKTFSTLNEALNYISTKMDIPLRKWVETSVVIKDSIQQKKLLDFAIKNIAVQTNPFPLLDSSARNSI